MAIEGSEGMPRVWCVRAQWGKYTRNFVEGGFMGIGWMSDENLSSIVSRDQLYPLYKQKYPDDKSNLVIGQQVGQIARFLFGIEAGDYVITPDSDTELLYYGKVDHSRYYYQEGSDSCPYRHRRKVEWSTSPLKRNDFSIPFQNTIRSSLTVFSVPQVREFLSAIGRAVEVTREAAEEYNPYQVVLEQILQLDDKEFEILVGHLLTALGFDGSEVTGKTGDGGVDATGELNVFSLAKVKVFVQAKRYKLGAKISAKIVQSLRASIPRDGQGAFITTADFQRKASEVALESGFPRIGLINGRQLVDLLIEHWNDIPEEFRVRLGLKPGLVKA